MGVTTPESLREPVIAWLAELGFEAFEELDEGVDAYIQANLFDESATRRVLFPLIGEPQWVISRIEPQNWNAVWEKAYDPVYVAGFCQVIADFHAPQPGYPYTLRIQPQMSFGTGHHETTRLMLQQLSGLSVKGNRVLDMGCGTGILAIMAAIMEASEVTAIDFDPWCVENTRENLSRNSCEHVAVALGDAARLQEEGSFEIILANINRSVLVADMETYVAHLTPQGQLVLSGFFQEDAPVLLAEAAKYGLSLTQSLQEGRWASLSLKAER